MYGIHITTMHIRIFVTVSWFFLACSCLGSTEGFVVDYLTTTTNNYFFANHNNVQRRRRQNKLYSTTQNVDDDKQLLSDNNDDENQNSKNNKWRRKDLFGQSLVEETIKDMETDVELQATIAKYKEKGFEQVTREERAARRRALDDLGVPNFNKFVKERAENPNNVLKRKEAKILQINIGLYCNQACSHCHVESSPLRTKEMMTAETAAQCLQLLQNTPSITTLDITGGAPELNTNFRYLVSTAKQIRPDIEIIDRCNLTVLQEPGQEDLIDFLKQHNVRIVASLPCYSQGNVDKQRGNGVFERSIAALLALNDAGYGKDDTNLKLDLVYNPSGAFLPPSQSTLEIQYKEQLYENFNILFNSLYTITNMPIKRFADYLHRTKELKNYMDLLVTNYNNNTINSLMCLDTISIGWDGTIYDCDFNQQLGYDIIKNNGISVFDLQNNYNEIQKYKIRTDNHCFGCTAGMGSS